MKRIDARAVLYGRSNRLRELADREETLETMGGERFAPMSRSSGQRDESPSTPIHAADGLQPAGG
jgi:hypothetical protein